ncbi:hypothetical protein C6T58_01620 [Burkholderia multivorans]|nr:hypothetical protein C6T58_01620 [Burkholderia multivorans]
MRLASRVSRLASRVSRLVAHARDSRLAPRGSRRRLAPHALHPPPRTSRIAHATPVRTIAPGARQRTAIALMMSALHFVPELSP